MAWRHLKVSANKLSSFELAERIRDKDKLTKKFCSRNKKKLEGLNDDEKRNMYFGSKVEEVAKKSFTEGYYVLQYSLSEGVTFKNQ